MSGLRGVLASMCVLAGAGVWPAVAAGQGAAALPGGTPLTVDFRRAIVGAWAEYLVTVGAGGGATTMTARWALVGRDGDGNTLELTLDGAGAAADRIGGKVVTRMVLAPDPVGMGRPIRRMVVQLAERQPVEIPLDLPGLPGQKFQNPDPKKLVGKQALAVAAGGFTTGHYRDVLPDSIVDCWLNSDVGPLGVVKVVSTPRPDAVGPGGRPLPPVTMELVAHGRDARPAITRPAVAHTPADRGKR
jgi:hypothetical protein